MSYAQFEASALPGLDAESGETLPEDEEQGTREGRAADIYDRAFRSLRESQADSKEEAVMLLEAWRDFEISRLSRYKALTVFL